MYSSAKFYSIQRWQAESAALARSGAQAAGAMSEPRTRLVTEMLRISWMEHDFDILSLEDSLV